MKNNKYATSIKASAAMPCYSELSGSRADILRRTVSEFQVVVVARECVRRNLNLQRVLQVLRTMSSVLVLLAFIGCAADGLKLSADHIRIKTPDMNPAPVAN